MRAVADGELARHWPEASSLAPRDFGREADRYCVLELRAALAGAEEPPDAPAEIADGVSAIRLATAAPLSAGPVLFETLDGRPFGIRPVLPIAATQPPGEPTRLDSSAPRLRPSCSAGSRSPTPTPLSRRRSTAGSCRCSRMSRSAPSSCVRRSRRCSARPGRCGRRSCSSPSPVLGRRACGARRAGCEETPLRRGSPTPRGGRSSRRSGTVTGRRSSAQLDEALLGVRERSPLRTAV